MTKAKRKNPTVLEEFAQFLSKVPERPPLPEGMTEEDFERQRAEEAREAELYQREIDRQPR